MLETSNLFRRLIPEFSKYRTFLFQGGTGSTKTYTILQLIYMIASDASLPGYLFSVLSESVPHLRRGALRDWMRILGKDYDPDTHNATEETFKIGKSEVEFFAVDNAAKARGGRRDFLFLNEANRISFETRNQLEVRTRLKEFIDFNPTGRFWAHDIPHGTGTTAWFDISTYNDAKGPTGEWLLAEDIRKSIESRKVLNPNWYRIYGEGQIGEIEGMIMPEVNLIPSMPRGLPTSCGLDFGFTNDPSVLLETGEMSGELWINQLFWGRGMTNQDIAVKMKKIGVPLDYLIYGDCAEPKSIREIYLAGFTGIRPCIKGPDCFRVGVDYIRSFKKINVTERSLEVIKDFRNATWERDLDGNYMNKAKKGYLHSIDATIYSLTGRIQPAQGSRGGNVPF